MEHAYEKLMKEHNLSFSELPVDARIGIESIQQIGKAIHLAEKNKRNIKPAVFDKIKANDKWVVREILDYIESKDSNQGPLPNKPDAVIDIIEPDASGKNPDPTPTPSSDPKPADKKIT